MIVEKLILCAICIVASHRYFYFSQISECSHLRQEYSFPYLLPPPAISSYIHYGFNTLYVLGDLGDTNVAQGLEKSRGQLRISVLPPCYIPVMYTMVGDGKERVRVLYCVKRTNSIFKK